ncbi:adenosine deaminase [Intrasporangium sp.]|uniref:adenosine deaminase n=1 Tax=Intrasporangium sp. TaxID=1925024 RepID=UPI00293B5C50|nr:adenosine deaminase [Intrasporangium sp.]MDV3220579.1 adenosine deaminase [Intrasporangium sp.]
MTRVPRTVEVLPKAHLHLHFTGSMRVETVRDLAEKHGLRLPEALLGDWPPQLAKATDERGWFRFQRLYDTARACVRGEDDMRRIVREAAEDDAAEGSRWLEIQVDPTSYAPFVGGITPAIEIVLDEARSVSAGGDIAVGVIVAANRMRHPLEARTLARLAARHAGSGPGEVVGFGLSNDERRGIVADFGPAFAIARRAGLALVPHGGELLGAQSVMETLEHLDPDRIGHGVRSVEDPQVLDAVAEAGVTLEVCPGSNVALGVYAEPHDVPLRRILDSGIRVALGADDPLLFGNRLAHQYDIARDLGCSDAELAELARGSITASLAPESIRAAALRDIDAWLSDEPKESTVPA